MVSACNVGKRAKVAKTTFSLTVEVPKPDNFIALRI